MTTVLVNGCFDLGMHVGHLRLLQFARKQGDHMIVAINSDESVRLLKGPSRPIIPEGERLEILYGFGADEVIVFEGRTPYRTITLRKPDVLVVSSHYTTDDEACRHVRSYGGRVVQAPDCGDVTTSGIIEQILRIGPC